MYEFKEKIKRLRIEKGLKQADIARSAGIKQATLASIEKPVELGGTKAMTIETGKGIAKALGISFNELFDVEAPGNSRILELEKKNSKLNSRIGELEEQIEDKRRIVKFLSDNDFTLDIASKIFHVEHPEQKSAIGQAFGMERKPGEPLLIKSPYDPGDKKSQIRYIESWFDRLEKNKKV